MSLKGSGKLKIAKETLDMHYALHEAEMQEVDEAKKEYNTKIKQKKIAKEQMYAILEIENDQLKSKLEDLQMEYERLKEIYEQEHSKLICFYEQSLFSFVKNKREKKRK